jgi:hypothetical protein
VTLDEIDMRLTLLVLTQPSLPSSFVTAILRLSFPVSLDAPSSELVAPATSSSTSAPSSWRHPTSIVSYLLKRDIVGEQQIEGGLTRYLARAGDWVSSCGISSLINLTN